MSDAQPACPKPEALIHSTVYENSVYWHKYDDRLSVIISKWHRDIGLTFSSVYLHLNALEHNFWSENSKTYLPFWPRKVKLCVVFGCLRCRQFWSHSDDTYTIGVCGISAFIWYLVCVDCMKYKHIVLCFSLVLIQRLGVRVVFCLGKHCSYRQLAESLPVKWVWNINRLLNVKKPWDTVSWKLFHRRGLSGLTG